MKFVKVRQRLVSSPLADIPGVVRQQLNSLSLEVPNGEVALTVGSRGIANLATILRTTGDWLREQGATPFAIPAMGSHNGATAEGQLAMVASLGFDEKAIGMPIRSSMETVVVGRVEMGDVHMDRHAFESSGVLVVNRVKLHTCFAGTLASGLTKMMVVGLGKLGGAETFHKALAPDRCANLIEMGRQVLATGKILAGLAILEDGFDQTSELHAVVAADIPSREPKLLKRHEELFARLPVDDINVLVVNTIGKNFSGTGMDTNVVGRRGLNDEGDLPRPRVGTIAALALSEKSAGNAIGVGLADFITSRLYNAIDMEKTLINTRATGDMRRADINEVISTDEALFAKLAGDQGIEGWVLIPNTLHLESLLVSPDVAEHLRRNSECDVGESLEVEFSKGQLVYDWY